MARYIKLHKQENQSSGPPHSGDGGWAWRLPVVPASEGWHRDPRSKPASETSQTSSSGFGFQFGLKDPVSKNSVKSG